MFWAYYKNLESRTVIQNPWYPSIKHLLIINTFNIPQKWSLKPPESISAFATLGQKHQASFYDILVCTNRTTSSPNSLYVPHKQRNMAPNYKGLYGIYYKISIEVVKSLLFAPGAVILWKKTGIQKIHSS